MVYSGGFLGGQYCTEKCIITNYICWSVYKPRSKNHTDCTSLTSGIGQSSACTDTFVVEFFNNTARSQIPRCISPKEARRVSIKFTSKSVGGLHRLERYSHQRLAWVVYGRHESHETHCDRPSYSPGLQNSTNLPTSECSWSDLGACLLRLSSSSEDVPTLQLTAE
ncbi:hypothetical protein CPB84DRAFT_1788867 [Gymnopilus junonius]|uniref:Uncharacterized protein n=1 Tax=Gymnopilus junonius TaxID=109634 RepID=A0A9P5TJG1_GYMJU|nr:hypothetical protein CPB84DRAFT_1788867 [Gymnopilus junonius]